VVYKVSKVALGKYLPIVTNYHYKSTAAKQRHSTDKEGCYIKIQLALVHHNRVLKLSQ
jgi:hypothetical protein